MLRKYLGLGPTVLNRVRVDRGLEDVFLGNHRAACKFALETGFLAMHVNFKVKC